MENKELTQNYMEIRLPDEKTKQAINSYRSNASKLYDTSSKKRPAIIFSNDGTGFGKSYGVINTYLDSISKNQSHEGNYNNLFFITPQKAQIDFAEKLLEKARLKNIDFVSFLARIDLINLDFESWIPEKNGHKITNRERYQRWTREGKKYKSLERQALRLEQVIRTIDSISKRIEQEKTDFDDGFGLLEDLQTQLFNQNNLLEKALQQLALSALNHDNSSTNLKFLIEAQEGIHALRKDIVCHYSPFVMAMIQPCIMLATTSKFDRPIDLPAQKKSGEYYFKSHTFDCILGGKKLLSEKNIGAYASSSFKDQLVFLKEQFFILDSANYFHEKEITFTLVIDEEHESYKVFAESASISLISSEIQLAHVFAAIHRVFMQVKSIGEKEVEEAPFYKEKQDFLNNIRGNLRNSCKLSLDHTLESVLKVFAGNIDFIQIRSGDVEQVINITRNVFSFSPKRYFNEQGLKRIRVCPAYGFGACQLYYTTDNNDLSPSLHDVYQITMSVLAAASQIPLNSEFLKSLRQGRDNSQNYPLYKFINRAIKVATEVKYMFDRVTDEELPISHFFTYFQPKTIFSIQRQKDLEFQDHSLSKLTYINFTLDLIKEQPEVSLLRILYNTQNSVICLSATSGFEGNFTGQYNRGFLRKYCTGSPDNLGIEIITRTSTDVDILSGLRNSRNQLRNVIYTPFDVKEIYLSSIQKETEFTTEYKKWHKQINKYAKTLSSQYHRQEFDRQLSAMLLAAYDAKNTLSLSLSNRFINALKDYLKDVKEKRILKPKNLEILEENCRIFKTTPFDNNIEICVILFSASLSRDIDVRQFTRITNKNLRIVFISAYRSAGTGLNYYINYPILEIEQDFERLVLINSPFWSEIIKDDGSGDRTLYSLKNYLRLMKKISNSREIKLLKDFDVNLVYGEDYRFLMHEHAVELLKVVMQAIGRVERKDTPMTTEVFLPDELLDVAMVQFTRLQRDQKNQPVLESMSLLNYKLMEYCKERSSNCSFSNEKARQDFEGNIEQSAEMLDEFFDEFVPAILEQSRQGNLDAIKLNEKLRSINSIIDPDDYIKKIKENSLVSKDKYICKIIDQLYINISAENSRIKLCRKDGNINILTDVEHGDSLYRPELQIVPNYSSKTGVIASDNVIKLMYKCQEVTNRAFKKFTPHPKFIPMLKGNMGEYLFSQLLELMDIQQVTPEKIPDVIGKRAYELFDSFIEIDHTLLCIDVKSWSSTLDKSYISTKSHQNALGKAETILSYVSHKYLSIKFIYVNTCMEYNPLNLEQEINDDQKIYYLNLFKEETSYRDKTHKGTDGIRSVGSELKHSIIINDVLLQILKGE